MSSNHLKPHDRYFRAVMAQLKVSWDFIEKALPLHIRQIIDKDSLKLEPESYVTDHLKLGVADLLFSARFAGEPGFIYVLFEHVSSSSALLPFRMMKYRVDIMADFLKKQEASEEKSKKKKIPKLPLIFPLVLYTGKNRFTHSMDFLELFGSQKTLAKELWETPCTLVDLSQLSHLELQKYSWFKTAAIAAKYVHQLSGENFLEPLSVIFDELQILDGLDEEWYIMITLQYLAIAGKIPDKERFVKAVQDKLSEETAMNLLQEFEKDGFKKGKIEGKLEGKLEGKREGIQQGLEKGKLEGKLEVALSLFADGLSLEKVAQLTGLSVDEIQAFQKKSQH